MIAWWAGEAPAAAPVWQTLRPAISAAVIAAVGAVGGTVWVKRMNKRLDDATTTKTVAESRKAEAETTSIEVTTARGLLGELKAMLAEQKADFIERETAQRQEWMARDVEKAEQIKELQAQSAENREQLRAVRTAFASHSTWDNDAVAALRQHLPGFPDPPAVTFEA